MNQPEPGQGNVRGPPADVVILDLSRVLTGPYAAMMLGDLGARVIQVEGPGSGDDTREWGPPFVGPQEARESTYFLSANRNKESIVLDLKDEAGRTTLEKLIRRSDVMIENFRPGVMDRLGFGIDDLFRMNPGLIALSMTGFGHDGPEADRAGYDQIVQGEGGLMSLTGRGPGQPSKVGVPIADILAGMLGAFGVLVALHERSRTGRGNVVRTSLLAGILAVHAFQGTRWLVAGEVPQPMGNRHPTVAPYGVFAARDGFLQIAVGNDAVWKRFAPLVGLDPNDERFRRNRNRVANCDELEKLIAERLGVDSVERWLGLFAEHGIPAGEIKMLDRVYEWAQVLSQGLVVEADHPTLGRVRLPGPLLRFDRGGRTDHLPSPTLGQHTEEILRWVEEEPDA